MVYLTDSEARELISLAFDGYSKSKEDGTLYTKDKVAKLIIRTYYSCVDKPDFDDIINNFKSMYLYNENKVEYVHSKEEKEGLGKVYDYVKNSSLDNISIYDLTYIHQELYSLTRETSFGGRYRNEEAHLLNEGKTVTYTGSVELTPFWMITHEMNLLKPEVDELVKRGNDLRNKISADKIIEYVNDCVKLKCKLIKIHPFGDGNGRSVRAFINLLFRLANLPPIYIENSEKDKYQEAMNKALVNEDFDSIIQFYYYKICDSIIALDVSINKENKMNKGITR